MAGEGVAVLLWSDEWDKVAYALDFITAIVRFVGFV
jgi:hypothetical protein